MTNNDTTSTETLDVLVYDAHSIGIGGTTKGDFFADLSSPEAGRADADPWIAIVAEWHAIDEDGDPDWLATPDLRAAVERWAAENGATVVAWDGSASTYMVPGGMHAAQVTISREAR